MIQTTQWEGDWETSYSVTVFRRIIVYDWNSQFTHTVKKRMQPCHTLCNHQQAKVETNIISSEQHGSTVELISDLFDILLTVFPHVGAFEAQWCYKEQHTFSTDSPCSP